MNRWPEAIGLAVSLHATLLLLPFFGHGTLQPPGADTRGGADLVELLFVPPESVRSPTAPARPASADLSEPGHRTPTVKVDATDRALLDTPALDRSDEHSTEPEPEPPTPELPAHVVFVRADALDPLVEAPDSDVIANKNLVATQVTRRETRTERIGPSTDGDPSATDVAGSSPVPDKVSVPQVEISDNKVPLERNRDDPSRPGARSGGEPQRSRAEAPEASEIGAPGGHAQERKASRGDEALDAAGAREPGEAGDDAPTRDGLAFASEGDFAAPSTGGADPADPRPEGPDRPSRSDLAVRPLLSPGILDWITPAESAEGGQPRSEPGEGDQPAPRVGEGTTGDGQARDGDATGIAETNPGERRSQRGSRAAAGGTGSAELDRALVLAEDVPLDVETAISAVETTLGRYAASIDQALRDGWEPPIEARVMSGYGVTTVTFRVDARGRVTDKTLLRQSGIPGLDDAALWAVPDRVPRPERGLVAGQSHLVITYTFRHNSPIVSRSAAR